MANSRIMLVCKHCGESCCIGKGYLGSYSTCNDELHKQLNVFYGEHEHGCCADDTDCSDNARNHFAILEEGESLDALVPMIEVIRCKVCDHSYKVGDVRICRHWDYISTKDDAYCSFAKMKYGE
jgi:hypothetical protein